MSSIIFDFDGTLADTLPIVTQMFYGWSGRTPFTQDEIDRFRNMTLREVMREVGISPWKFPSLLVKGRAELAKGMTSAALFDGVGQTLAGLQQKGHMLFLASSNSTANIEGFIGRYTLGDYFEAVYGNIGVFGKAKVLKGIMRQHKLKEIDTYYVGDETRDIEAAKKAGVHSVAVGWGYNGSIILKAHRPEYFADTPQELLSIV